MAYGSFERGVLDEATNSVALRRKALLDQLAGPTASPPIMPPDRQTYAPRPSAAPPAPVAPRPVAPTTTPGTIPHSGDVNDPYPGHTFKQGVGWLQNDAPQGLNPYGADDHGRPIFDPSRLPPTSSYPTALTPKAQPGQIGDAPAAPAVAGTTAPAAGPGEETITNDVGDTYTIPSDWGPYRGQMKGYSTQNYDARGSYRNGSPEFGRQLAVAKIVSHIDPKSPTAHQELEAGMTKAGLKWTRLDDGSYSFSEVGKPNQPGVHLLKNGEWTWIDHAKLGGGGGASPDAAAGGGGGTTAQPGLGTPAGSGLDSLLETPDVLARILANISNIREDQVPPEEFAANQTKRNALMKQLKG